MQPKKEHIAVSTSQSRSRSTDISPHLTNELTTYSHQPKKDGISEYRRSRSTATSPERADKLAMHSRDDLSVPSKSKTHKSNSEQKFPKQQRPRDLNLNPKSTTGAFEFSGKSKRNNASILKEVRAQREVEAKHFIEQREVETSHRRHSWIPGGACHAAYNSEHAAHVANARKLFLHVSDDSPAYLIALREWKKEKDKLGQYHPLGGLGPDFECDRFREEYKHHMRRKMVHAIGDSSSNPTIRLYSNAAVA